jgi:type VI secretion system protein ImpD
MLGDLGLIPLSAIPGEDCAAFYTTPSLHAPPRYSTVDATINARLSALLQYVLCASRVAHYIKVICRDLVGSFITPKELERRLNSWLHSITLSSENASDEMQARFPLKEASVSVREVPGRPGSFTSVIHLCPHFQLDQMTSSLRLVTEVVTGR